MNLIYKHFFQMCDNKYTDLGFKRIKQSYVRIINDILQTFALKQYHHGNICTVEFGILPLCMNIESLEAALHYSLDCFDVKVYAMHGGWRYSSLSKECVLSCLSAIATVMDCELMPLFMRTSCCSSALIELIRLDEKFDQNRIAALKWLGETDCAEPWQSRSLCFAEKYFFSLKSNNLQYARDYLRFNIQMYENKLVSFGELNAPKQPEIVIYRIENKLAQLKKQLEMLERNNMEYFDELVNSSENKTKTALLSKYPQLRNQ